MVNCKAQSALNLRVFKNYSNDSKHIKMEIMMNKDKNITKNYTSCTHVVRTGSRAG